MKLLYLLLFLFPLTLTALPARSERDSLLGRLDKAIADMKGYDLEKLKAIDSIRALYNQAGNDAERYVQALQLYEQYKIFKFDSAFTYARVIERIAEQLGNEQMKVAARNKLAFITLSAGKFREAQEYLQSIDPSRQPDSVKAEYYALVGRYYYDIADYNSDDYYSPKYRATGNVYFDSALVYIPRNSFNHLYYTGLRDLKLDSLDKAFDCFTTLLARPELSAHQRAVVHSTLSYLYVLKGNKEQALNYQVRAVIDDIKSCTKETIASFNLAQLLFEQGDFEKASVYIELAIDDATFYGAQQRKVQVSAILPIIQGAKISYIERQRRLWLTYALIATSILLVLILLVLVIFKQFSKLKRAEKTILDARNNLEKANLQLHTVNTALQSVNSELQDVNGKLEEANSIKEEYIGYFFNMSAVFFDKIARFKQMIDQKMADRKMEELRMVINNINIRAEKEDLLKNFDKVFLKLFPGFVHSFNELFHEADRIVLKGDELLNNELRIYALMRMGITENEKIAQILEYSVKTIYAYKTKIRNRTIIPKDEFDKRVMAIQ
jgi:hypothetical protein